MGQFEIEVKFTPESLNMLRDAAGRFMKMDDFRYFWHNYQIGDIIKKSIQANIEFGMEPPFGTDWAPLSESYQKQLASKGEIREYMVLRKVGSETGIYDAYVDHPIIDDQHAKFLRYSPDYSRLLMPGLDLKLRFGSGSMPGREWFGLTRDDETKLEERLNMHIQEQLQKIGKAKVA